MKILYSIPIEQYERIERGEQTAFYTQIRPFSKVEIPLVSSKIVFITPDSRAKSVKIERKVSEVILKKALTVVESDTRGLLLPTDFKKDFSNRFGERAYLRNPDVLILKF